MCWIVDREPREIKSSGALAKKALSRLQCRTILYLMNNRRLALVFEAKVGQGRLPVCSV